jgi:crotonobetaine/carnitine-CoA ligase
VSVAATDNLTAGAAPPLPLGQLVRSRAGWPEEPPLLTFVGHDASGAYVVAHRHYASLWRRGQAIARALAARGVAAGDRFALQMQNHAEFADAVVASAILGAVFVPIDPRTRGKKLQYMLDAVGCKGVIAGTYCLEALQEVVHEAPSVGWVLLVGPRDPARALPARTEWLDDVVVPDGPDLPVAGDRLDMAMQMMFTSGTTGDPKAIVGTYQRYASIGDIVRALGVVDSDRMYTGLSMTHGNALMITMGGALYTGVPAVFSLKFTKSRLWSVIRDFRCTTMNLLGGMFSAIYSEPPTERDADNPLRVVLSAGMPKNLWESFEKRFDLRVLEFYGASEGGLLVKHPGVGPIGSIGRPPPNLIAHILDEEDRECAPFQPGEIVFENADGSPAVVDYFGNPDASQKKTRGGWLRMGDIGYRDDEGWFYFMHRMGNEIRRNGDFISPGFLEKEIAEHPNVIDVFVYGVKSTNGTPGEKDVVAAIVAQDARAWDAESVFAFCETRLEKNSVPSYLQLVDEIPKTASEKPLERVLLETFSPSAANVFVRRSDDVAA